MDALTDIGSADPSQDPTQYPIDVPVDEPSVLDGAELTYVDSDGDYVDDVVLGYLAGVGSFAVADLTGDGLGDVAQFYVDGTDIVSVQVEALDDGTWLLSVDADGDGELETTRTVTTEEIQANAPEMLELLALPQDPAAEVTLPGLAPGIDPEILMDPTQYPAVVDGQVVGDPDQYSDLWFEQSFDGSCLPAAVAQIYSLYTGETVSDQEFVTLVNNAAAAGELPGWIVGSDGIPGLPPETAAGLLQAVGIPAVTSYGTVDTLTDALADGRSVMITIDSGEVWNGERQEDDNADHAVLVAGIDVEAGVVYLSDTGIASGNMEEVPLDVFMDAWADSGNLMVECTEPAPGAGDQTTDPTAGEPLPEVEVFDLAAGEPLPEAEVFDLAAGAGFYAPSTDLPGADTLTAGTPTLDELLDRSPTEQVVGWLSQHPWIIVPVAIAAGAVVRSVGQRTAR